jgi:hypothetical protein
MEDRLIRTCGLKYLSEGKGWVHMIIDKHFCAIFFLFIAAIWMIGVSSVAKL